MTRFAARLTLAALALLALAGIPLVGYWTAAPAILLLILGASPLLHARESRSGLVGSVTGLLGGATGIGTALAAIVKRGTEAPHDARIGFAVAALLLAALALAGGTFLASRPRRAVGMLLMGSTAGCLTMAFFTVDTWYFVALPLCWLAASIAAVQPAGLAGVPRGAARRRHGEPGSNQ